MGTTTTNVLALYLGDTGQAKEIVQFVRAKFPASLSTTLTTIKKQWLQLELYHEGYAPAFAALLASVKESVKSAAKGKKAAQTRALAKLEEFSAMNLADKHRVQRTLRTNPFASPELDAQLALIPLLPDYMLDLKVTPEERAAMVRKAQVSLEKKSSRAWEVKGSKTLKRARTVLLAAATANPFDLACALAVVCGRRMVELFKTGVFAAAKNQYTAMFSGQVKKLTQETYLIPLLVPYSLFKVGLEKLRSAKSTEGMNNNDVNLKWSNSCNTCARRVLGPHHKFHDFRMVYAVLSYNMALPHSLSLNLWVSRVLGHSGMGNSLHYTSIYVTELDEEDKHRWPDITETAA